MGSRHGRLAAGLSAAWESELVSSRTLTLVAEEISEPHHRARLLVLSAFCRAHASRLLARLAAMGRGPLPVPPEVDLDSAPMPVLLEREAKHARACAARYAQLTEHARAQGDVSSAWVCELNRTEETERADELMKLVEAMRAPPPEHRGWSSQPFP